MVNCPVCDAPIDVDEDELDEGDVVECEECAAALTVVSTDPLEFAAEESEDEDEEEEDDEFSDDEEEEEEENW
jgi:alpha-aminoadipate carrier protein LysW